MSWPAGLGIVVAWGASIAGGFFYGVGFGADREVAGQARIERVIADTREAARLGTADAIAANRPVNTTIVQRTRREIRESTVYADCRVPADGVRLANEAITGRSEPARGGVLPRADTTP